MLIVKIGKTYATIKENTIPVVLRSPVFMDAENDGSYLFNFSVLLTEQLKKELGYPNRPGSLQKVFRKHVEVRFGELIFSGTSRIKSVDDSEAELYLPANNGMLASMQRNITLPELNTGGMRKTFQYLSRGRQQMPQSVFIQSSSFLQNTRNLVFAAIESDVDNLFQSGGQSWKAARSGIWDISVNLGVRIILGQQFRFQILVNNEVAVTRAMGKGEDNMAFFSENGTGKIIVKLNLLLNDTLSFRILSATEQHPTIPINPWRIEYYIEPATKVAIFINFSFLQATNVQYPYSDFTSFPVFNPSFYDDAPDNRFLIDEQDMSFLNEKFPVTSYFKNNEFPISVSGQAGQDYFSVFNTMIPYPYIASLVKWIMQKTGTVMENNAFEHSDIAQLVLAEQNAINIFDYSGFTTVMDQYNLSDLLPDVSIARFFSDQCMTLGIVFRYDPFENRIYMKTLEQIMNDKNSVPFSHNLLSKPRLTSTQYDGYILSFAQPNDDFLRDNVKPLDEVNLKGSVNTLGNLPLINNQTKDCYLVVQEDAYYHWAQNEETGQNSWRFYSINFQVERKVLFDEEEENPVFFEYELPVCPVMMYTRKPLQDQMFGSDDRKWLIPAMQRIGYFAGLPKQDPQYGLLFYRGRKADSNGNVYPLASNDTKDYSGQSTTQNPLSLKIDDSAHSLFTKRFKKFVEWRAKTEGVYTMRKLMNAKDLKNVDFFKWHNVYGTDYLIKEMRFELGHKDKIEVEIDIVSRLTRNV